MGAAIKKRLVKSIMLIAINYSYSLKSNIETNKAYLLQAKAIKAVSIICILQKVSGYTTGSKLLTVAASAVGVVLVEVGA